jgi:hypothetical protein
MRWPTSSEKRRFRHFTEVGLLAGLAYDMHGIGQGTMGVECADYDNDGRLDFHMTSYQNQWAILYHNLAEDCSRMSPTAGAGVAR